jgi:peptide deformylase
MASDLIYYGDPVLKKTAVPVEAFDEGLAELASGMVEAMRLKDGVGLAAPQVGVPLRLFVVDASEEGEEGEPYVVVNPEFVYLSDEKAECEEGCLSLPGISLKVVRHARVSVKARNERGEEYLIENAEGLLSRALQHENDHLNGILLIDRVSPVQRGLLRSKLKKIQEKARDE